MAITQRLIDAKLLRDYIRIRGLSQRRLALAVDCHRSMINHLCSPARSSRADFKVSTELATAIAEALDVPLTTLFVPVMSRGTGQRRKIIRTRTTPEEGHQERAA